MIGIEADLQGTKKEILTQAERECDDHFNETTVYKNEKFTVELPFKKPKAIFPNNYTQAVSRLKSTEKLLKRSPDPALSDYHIAMQLYLDKGFAREITKEELSKYKEGEYFYLPHHPVYKEGKKVRVVFDGAATFKGVALNEQLHGGSKLILDLFDVILRFRKFKYIVMADIAAMFNQVSYDEASSQFCRYLWRNNETEKEKIYLFLKVIFGLRPSPYQTLNCVMFLAKKFALDFPAAIRELEEQLYCDDWMSSFQHEKDLLTATFQLIELLAKGGFPLLKFVSSSTLLIESIPPDLLNPKHAAKELPSATKQFPEDVVSTTMKTLGVVYEIDKDNFTYELEKIVSNWKKGKLTKREALSRLASVFDPMGFMAPYVADLKVIVQESWMYDLLWDDLLPTDLQNQWEAAVAMMAIRGKLSVSRHMHFDELDQDETAKMEFIVCCDASEKLYAATIHSRVFCKKGIFSTLVASKSRVAPISKPEDDSTKEKRMTIPRLELTSAHLAVKFMSHVLKTLKLKPEWTPKISTLYFTDSAISLAWIWNDKAKFLAYVENRVNYIREHTEKSQWFHVRTENNPADAPTRGLSALKDPDFDKDWSQGMPWVREGRMPLMADLPSKELIDIETLRESRRFHKACITSSAQVTKKKEKASFLDTLMSVRAESREDTWNKTIRRLSTLLIPFKLKSKKLKEFSCQQIYFPHWLWKEAENILLRLVQQESFSADLFVLKSQQLLSVSARLGKLNAFLDNKGIIRIRSRLEMGDETNEEHPIVLSGDHPMTQNLIMHHHFLVLHGKTDRTLSSLSARFYILSASRFTKQVIHHCMICRDADRKLLTPPMGSLPEFRTTFDGTFNNAVGIDFAGPFLINYHNQPQKKVYVLLVVDCAIRLLTLVTTLSLKTSDVIKGLEEYIHRRGVPQKIISDNGTSLVAASALLKKAHGSINWKEIKNHFQPPRSHFDWQTIPSYSPWIGAHYERLNRVWKNCLYKTFDWERTQNRLEKSDLRKKKLKSTPFNVIPKYEKRMEYEDFRLAILRIESVVNDRPLIHLSSSIDIPRSISPNEILFGRSHHHLPELVAPAGSDLELAFKRRQKLQQIFVQHFKSSYLRSLVPYKKWHQQTGKVCAGDVVHVVDKGTKYWRLGIIENAATSKDGQFPTTVIIRSVNNKGIICIEKVSTRNLKLLEAQPYDRPQSSTPSSSTIVYSKAIKNKQHLDDSVAKVDNEQKKIIKKKLVNEEIEKEEDENEAEEIYIIRGTRAERQRKREEKENESSLGLLNPTSSDFVPGN